MKYIWTFIFLGVSQSLFAGVGPAVSSKKGSPSSKPVDCVCLKWEHQDFFAPNSDKKSGELNKDPVFVKLVPKQLNCSKLNTQFKSEVKVGEGISLVTETLVCSPKVQGKRTVSTVDK